MAPTITSNLQKAQCCYIWSQVWSCDQEVWLHEPGSCK